METKVARSLSSSTRLTVAGDGTLTEANRAYCPRRRESLSPEVCQECAEFGGAVREHGVTTVYCCAASAQLDFIGERQETAFPPRQADSVCVTAVMRPLAVCVRPEVQLEAVCALLLSHALLSIPVVDDAGRPVGLVTQGDALNQLLRAKVWHTESLAVADFMQRNVPAVSQTASIAEAAAVVAFDRAPRLVVLSGAGEVVGTLEAVDIVDWLAEQNGYTQRRT